MSGETEEEKTEDVTELNLAGDGRRRKDFRFLKTLVLEYLGWKTLDIKGKRYKGNLIICQRIS